MRLAGNSIIVIEKEDKKMLEGGKFCSFPTFPRKALCHFSFFYLERYLNTLKAAQHKKK